MSSRSIDDLNGKSCKKCGNEKPISEFPVKNGKAVSKCKICTAEYLASWHQANKVRRNKAAEERRKANPERERERSREWVSKNRDVANGYSKSYRERNPEKVKLTLASLALRNKEAKLACYKSWAGRNKEKVLRRNRERQHAKIQAIPSWHGEFDEFVFEEAFALSSMRLAATGIEYNVDHIVPLKSKRVCGLHCAINLAVIPALENKSKGNRHWPDMGGDHGI